MADKKRQLLIPHQLKMQNSDPRQNTTHKKRKKNNYVSEVLIGKSSGGCIFCITFPAFAFADLFKRL